MEKQLDRLWPVVLVTLVACGPRVAPATPDADHGFYEKSDAGIVLPLLVDEVDRQGSVVAFPDGAVASARSGVVRLPASNSE